MRERTERWVIQVGRSCLEDEHVGVRVLCEPRGKREPGSLSEVAISV